MGGPITQPFPDLITLREGIAFVGSSSIQTQAGCVGTASLRPSLLLVPVRVSRKARRKTWNMWRNFQDVADPAGADGRWHPWIVTGLGTACSWAPSSSPSSLRRRAGIWALVVAAGTAPCPGVFPVGTMPWLAGKESSQESPHPAQDRLEIPIHSSGSTPARAPRAGQSQKNPGQIQG